MENVKKSKYVFDNGYEKYEHYLYGIKDSDNLLRIVNEHGEDPHLVYRYADMTGIWGAIDELVHGLGEEVSDEEYKELVNKWIETYNHNNPKYHYPKNDNYYRVIEEVKVKNPTNGEWYEAVMYVNDMTDKPKYIREKKDFYKKFIKV